MLIGRAGSHTPNSSRRTVLCFLYGSIPLRAPESVQRKMLHRHVLELSQLCCTVCVIVGAAGALHCAPSAARPVLLHNSFFRETSCLPDSRFFCCKFRAKALRPLQGSAFEDAGALHYGSTLALLPHLPFTPLDPIKQLQLQQTSSA